MDFLIKYKKSLKYDISTIKQRVKYDSGSPKKRKTRQTTLARAMVKLKSDKSPPHSFKL